MRSFFRPEVLRSFVFGVEDSLVSTVGLVSGIAVVGSSRPVIVMTGVILIFVEAFSMAVGDLLSDNAARELQSKAETPLQKSFTQAAVMFFSYILSGFLVLLPYLLLAPVKALPLSIGIAVILLFALGAFGGRISGISVVRNGITMALVGGAAILIGMGAGIMLQQITGAIVL